MEINRLANVLQKGGMLLLVGVLTAWPAFGKDADAVPSRQIKVKVDGLSCPFCAFGLEKYLKKIEGTKKVTIYVDEGKAILRLKEDAPLDTHSVSKAVKKGGFTPREITVTAVGKIAKENEQWVFHPRGIEKIFLLSKNDKLKEIQESKILGKEILLTGVALSEKLKGHGEHPKVLEIQDYQVIEK